MNTRTVNCAKFLEELPGLEKPPFAGALGDEIYQKISQKAWEIWQKDLMIKVINEYRLNLADPAQYQTLIKQMRAFLNLDTSEKLLEVENEARGKAV